jgi:tetratricopeptide (TPR) repeat protein
VIRISECYIKLPSRLPDSRNKFCILKQNQHMYKLLVLIILLGLINSTCSNTSAGKKTNISDKRTIDSVSSLFAQGKYNDVIDLCTKMIKTGSENPIYRMLRGVSYSRIDQRNLMLDDNSYIITHVSDTVSTIFYGKRIQYLRWALDERGKYWMGIGAYEKALSDYGSLLRLNNRNADAISAMATIYSNMGNLNIADSLVNLAYNIDSSTALVTANVGLIVLHTNPSKAIIYLTKALNKGEDEDYYNRRGEAYMEVKKYELAEKDFKRSIELNPNNIESYLFYATMLKQWGRKPEACEALHKALEHGAVVVDSTKFLEVCK